MSIRFSCPDCGHTIDVADRFAGLSGHCKQCGHAMKIPGTAATAEPPPTAEPVAAAPSPGSGGFKLRPVEGLDVPTATATTPAPTRAPLQVRPLAAADPVPEVAVPPPSRRDERPVEILDPYRFTARRKRERINPHYETRLARFAANVLKTTRDRLYLLTVALLVMVLIGFLFKLKPLIHFGTIGVVVVNIAMLVDGAFYLLVLPFKHSLAEGMGVVLVPPYALYYWYRHWDRMKRPFWNTVTAFLPICLAGLAYLFYQEAPVIWEKVEQADQVVERAVGIEPGAAPDPRGQQPGVADQAKQVLGNEANIIQQLAQPQ